MLFLGIIYGLLITIIIIALFDQCMIKWQFLIISFWTNHMSPRHKNLVPGFVRKFK